MTGVTSSQQLYSDNCWNRSVYTMAGVAHHGLNIVKNATIQTTTEIDLSKLSPEERWRIEHQRMHEKHRGHEAMHAEMILILIFTLVIAQICLFEWKKRHFKSYQSVSLVGLWIIPTVLSLKQLWLRFLFFWFIFSVVTAYILKKAVSKPIAGTTPRLVYKWFYLIYQISYGLGIIGYIILMLALFGLNLIFNMKPNVFIDTGLLLIFYGLYYGVLGLDISEIATNKMAAHIGYYTETGVPVRLLTPNICAVCGNQIIVTNNDDAIIEKTYRLSCDHVFHEFCIRGWCIIGKKQTCPYCKEKVDLKRMFCNPWEKPHVLYGQLLDWIRYLVAWQPLIIMLVQAITYFLGLE